MLTKSKSTFTLPPGIVLVACLAHPAGAAAQSAPPDTGTDLLLGDAMAEARRGPFHAGTATWRLAAHGQDPSSRLAGPAPHRSRCSGGSIHALPAVAGAPVSRLPCSADPQGSELSGGPSFHRVFWPSLGGVLAPWAVLAGLDLAGLEFCHEHSLTRRLGGEGECDTEIKLLQAAVLTTLFLLPPTAAKLAGASFPNALLGSLLGMAGGFVLGGVAYEADVLAVAIPLIPIVHAGLITVFARR